MSSFSRSGVDIHYDRRGQGQPVLLLAGMASDSASWGPVSWSLAKEFEVITVDNRCTGQTTPLPVETSRDLVVQDILALLDHCEIEKISLIGHSLGAVTSWAVAAVAPERVNALVAASGAFTSNQTRVELFNTLARLRTDSNEEDWFRLLYHFLFGTEFFANTSHVDDAVQASLSYPYKQSRAAFSQQCASLPSYVVPVELPKTLPFPSLALTGENDILFTPADLRTNYATHPEVRLEVIKDAAHSVHWENQEAFVNLVKSFLLSA